MTAMVVLAGARPAASPTYIAIRPAGRLGDLWEAYKLAIRGTVFDFEERVNMAPRHIWPGVYSALKAAGFEVTLTPTAKAWLDQAGQAEETLVLQAEERLGRLSEQLAQAGMPLRQYQLDGIHWLIRQRAAFLLDQQGLGKTVQTLCAIPSDVGVIIECPATLRYIWRDEVKRWRNDLSVVVTPTERDHFWPAANEVFIVSDGWVKSRVAVQPWPSPPLRLFLVSDEAHRFKGRSQRAESMDFLCADIRRYDGWTLALTGTPVMNDPPELYSLFRVFGCARKAFGGWTEFRSLWDTKVGRYKEVIWGDPSPEVRARVQLVSLRRERAEVLSELPPESEEVIPCEVGTKLMRQLDDVWSFSRAAIDEWEESDRVVPPMSITQHTELWNQIAKAKTADMLAWCDRMADEGDPVVVFTMHLAPLDALRARKRWSVISGEVSPLKRRDLVEDFQAGKYDGMGLTIRSGGTGLTLTKAHRVLFVERSYVPSENDQAKDRVSRFGQTQPVIISRLVVDHPLERRLDEVIQKKTRMIRAVVQANSGFTK